MTYAWHDLTGNLGVAMVLSAYLGLQLDMLDARGLSYSLINATGAALVVVSLCFDFNLSAFLIEGVWVLISIFGVLRWARGRRAPAAVVAAGTAQAVRRRR